VEEGRAARDLRWTHVSRLLSGPLLLSWYTGNSRVTQPFPLAGPGSQAGRKLPGRGRSERSFNVGDTWTDTGFLVEIETV
jgi:hypothetical protein